MQFRAYIRLKTLVLAVFLLIGIIIWSGCNTPLSNNKDFTNALPDLIITNVSWKPEYSVVEAGAVVHFFFHVKNIGGTAARGYVRVSGTGNYSGGFADGLNAGEEKIVIVKYPFTGRGATYRIHFTVDAENLIPESNNHNNSTDSITIKTALGKIYRISSLQSGLFLDANLPDVYKNGCRIQLWEATGGTNQLWDVYRESVGYRIKSLASGLFLDASLSNIHKDGCKIQLWEATGKTNQLWYINKNGGSSRLQSCMSYLALDAHASDVYKNGCRIQLWRWLGRTNQSWLLEPQSPQQSYFPSDDN